MTKKEAFIQWVIKLNEPIDITVVSPGEVDGDLKLALEYFNELRTSTTTSIPKPELTENGVKILKYMQDNYSKYNNIFKSKEIGEGIFASSRSVSGSMKKLITSGFVEKVGSDPVVYAITDIGKSKDLNNIKNV